MHRSAAEGEILFGMLPGEESGTLELLRMFDTAPVTEAVIDLGPVMLEGGRLITQNVRHFPMLELEVEQGWS